MSNPLSCCDGLKRANYIDINGKHLHWIAFRLITCWVWRNLTQTDDYCLKEDGEGGVAININSIWLSKLLEIFFPFFPVIICSCCSAKKQISTQQQHKHNWPIKNTKKVWVLAFLGNLIYSIKQHKRMGKKLYQNFFKLTKLFWNKKKQSRSALYLFFYSCANEIRK